MAGDINKSVNIAINVINGVSKQVTGIANSFSKLTTSANASTKAISDLNKQLGKLKAPSGLKTLSKDLKAISQIDGKGITKAVSGMEKLGKVKFPSFTKLNTELSKHAKTIRDVVSAYNSLAVAAKKVNLSSLSTNAKKGTSAVNKLNASTKRSSASFSQWGYALGSASTGLSKFGTQIYGVTRGFSAVSKEMGVAMAAFTTGFATLFALKGVITDITEFDDAIRAAGAVAQASSVELEAFSDAARAMGESTRYTAKDAAEALKALAMTGLEVNEAIATLPTVLNLAAAANMDLGASADIVTNIMIGYQKTVKDLPAIADMMTAAFTNSNTSLQELGVALKYVGPVANAAGQELAETTGILASLANAGYRGSKAGTTLRTSIARLLSPTQKVSETLAHYGITLDQLTKADGSMIAFSDIIALMESKSISAGDALTIFGKRAGPGMLALIGQGTTAIEKMNQKIAESEGTALKAAYEMEAGLGGALRKLKSMWQELSIAIGKSIEQDVQSFVERMTKSIKDNKEALVNVVKVMFDYALAIAKVIGWITKVVADNIELVASLTAVAAIVKLMNTALYATVATKAAQFFASLATGVAWSSIISGIAGINAALMRYIAIMNAGKGSLLLKTMFSGLSGFNFAGIAAGIKGIGVSLLTFGRLAGAAVIASGPIGITLTAVAAAATAAYTALSFLDTDYEKVAQSAIKVAKASSDANRELEYQAAELGLINKEFARGNVDDYTSAEERLIDIVNQANIPLADRIEYLKRARLGTDEAKKVIKELTDALNEEKKANDTKEIQENLKAREAMTKAIRKEAIATWRLYGVWSDNQDPLTAMEGFKSGVMDILTLWGLYDKTLGDGLKGHTDEMERLKKEQTLVNGNYKTMIDKMIVAGKSAEEFAEAVAETVENADDIPKLTEAYKDLQEQAEKDEKVMASLAKNDKSRIEAKETIAKEQLNAMKSRAKEEESVKSRVFYNLAVLEAQGELTHEQAEMAKLQASMDAASAAVALAKKTHSEIDEDARESREAALEAIVAAEKQAATVRLKILEELAQTEEVLVEKTKSLNEKKSAAITAYNKKALDLKQAYNKTETDAETTKTNRIDEINEALKVKLNAITEDIGKKREEFSEKRVELELAAAQKIASINTSAEDKIRAILQRAMTDKEKDTDNRSAANKKLKEGEEAIAEAKRTGDEAALARGTNLIGQAQDLYAGLESEKTAIDGVKKASEQLKEADTIRVQLALKELAKKEAAEEKAAKQKTQLAENAAKTDIENAEDIYKQKEKAAKDLYNQEIQDAIDAHNNKLKLIEAEIKANEGKIEVIEQQKSLVLDLIEQQKHLQNLEGGTKGWDKANEATQSAIDKVGEYGKAIEKTNDQEVNLNFTGTASPTEPLGAKLDEIKAKLEALGAQVIVDVSFQSEGISLGKYMKDQKEYIEGMKITLPVDMNTDDLDEVLGLIAEIRRSKINLTVNVDKGELNETAAMLKDIVSKLVTLKIKVLGYDALVKAKNMIDSIRSKTVVVTTRHRSVQEKAAGGYIEPEHYATGGNVFRKLGSSFIGKGGGKKDDVPAMLMRGEFVQKVSAVKKYGKDFMARLNAGIIPRSVVGMFNSGGPVEPEHYASGGHVGYSSAMRKMRKKHEDELLGKRSEIANTMNINLSNGIGGFGAISDSGMNAISSLRSVIQDSISSFATGGSTFGSAGINQLTSDLNKSYGDKIKIAKGTGDNALAAILKKEQDEINQLSQNLSKDLKELEVEYRKFKASATTEHRQKIDEIKATYSEDITELDDSHNEAMADIKENYLDNVSSIDESKAGSDDEFKEAKEQYESEKESLAKEREDAKLANAQTYREAIVSGHALGREISYILGTKEVNKIKSDKVKADNRASGRATGGPLSRSTHSNAGAFTLEEYMRLEEKKLGPYKSKGNPDFVLMRKMLGDAFPELRGLLSGKQADFVPEGGEMTTIAMSTGGKIKHVSGGQTAIGSTSSSKSTSSAKLLTTKDALALSSQINELESVMKSTSSSATNKIYKDRLDAILKEEDGTKDQYKKTSEELAKNRSENQASYDSYIADENDNYKKQKDDYTKIFKSDIKSQNSSYSNEMGDKTTEYKGNTAKIKNEFLANRQTIRDAAAEESKEQKQITTSDVGALRTVLDEELKKVGVKSGSTSFSSLMKSMRIPGFNTGGFINGTSTSVPGKDSILASLTPSEYVMKAPVVRKFGKGFFDSLNNFKIPHFNSGGIVGNIDTSSVSGVTQTVKHALELSINGNTQGELYGSQPTIANILNDLTLAKLRS